MKGMQLRDSMNASFA